MMKTAQHLSIIMIIGAMLVLVGYSGVVSTAASYQATLEATGQATAHAANLPATRPVIRLNVNGGTVEGAPGSSCWPASGSAPQCDFVEEVQPGSPVSVTEGTDLKFEVDPAAPAPQEFRATLTDDKAPDGSPLRVDLIQSSGAYKIEGLSAGGHHVLVEAFYPGEGAESQFFVSSVFLLQVGTVTVAATEAGTEVAAALTAEAPTAEPTSAEPTEPVATEPSAAGFPTVEPPTVVPPTVAPPTVEQPTAEPTTTEPTEPVATEPSAAGFPTVEPPTVVPPTVAPPTLIPTTVPLPTLEPTATAIPTVVPATVVPPTEVAALPSGAATAPNLVVVVSGRNYDPVAVNACVLSPDGTQTCVRRPSNAAAERIFAAAGDTAQIAFKGPRPTVINASILSADAVTLISRQTVHPDNLTLYTLPTAAGNYVLAVDVIWPTGTATYYYRLTVNS